jgi:hypothetical protein
MRRATSVSICAGAAPGRLAVTLTMGRSMSGNCWIFIARKPSSPAAVSMMKSRIEGTGLAMDQRETLNTAFPYGWAGPAAPTPLLMRTLSPSARKPRPLATTWAWASRPSRTSTHSWCRRPSCTLRWRTFSPSIWKT